MRKCEAVSAAAVAAAEWWAEQVGAPTFRNTDARDAPADRETSAMAGIMATLLAENHPVSADTGQRFAEILARAIEERLSDHHPVTLSVDYGPDGMLSEAAEASGVSLSRFPWKTVMWVKRDHVVAALGYRTPGSLIWTAEDWQRPVCGAREWPEDGPRDRLCGRPVYHDGEHGDWQPDPTRCVCGKTYSECHAGRHAGHYFQAASPSEAVTS